MSKIFACCNWKLKFLGPILDWWRAVGHEVQYKLGYDPALHEWADVCFVDVCDHNAIVASRQRFEGSRLVIRCIDIECWVRQPRGVTWENVDAVVFGAHHIERLVRSLVDFPANVQVLYVPFGVDLDKWAYRQHDGSDKKVACVCYRWSAKGLPLVLQVMAKLPDYSLHILGKPSSERWLNAYVDEMVARLGLDVTFTDQVPSVDDWLEDKDFFILGSQKEAFSYATAEAAAKGLRPVVHNFHGAREVWPDAWLWDTVDEAVGMIGDGHLDSASYRQFIADNYSLARMMRGLNRACGLS